MNDVSTHSFNHIPKTPQGHFVLYFYAAVFRLINRLQALSQVGGSSLESFFIRYPFLGEYYNEILNYLPNDISWLDALQWWKSEISAWETECDTYLPIQLLKEKVGLTFDNRLAFIAVGLAEEDSRFGTIFAELQAPLDLRRPTLEFIAQTVSIGLEPNKEDSAWSLCQPLIDLGLVEVMNDQVPRSEWIVRVPSILWDAVRGKVKENPTNWSTFHLASTFPDVNELIFPQSIIERTSRIPELIAQSKISQVLLRSDSGTDTVEVLGAVAKSMGLNLIVINGNTATMHDDFRLLGPLCSMSNALPVFEYETDPGDTIQAPVLNCYKGMICYTLGMEGGISSRTSERMLSLTLDTPDIDLRKRFWRSAMNGTPVQDIDKIVDHFHISGGYIKHLSSLAVAIAGSHGRNEVLFHDVQDASRTLNRQKLDTLADRLETTGTWHDLVVTQSSGDKLLELERRCLYREKLHDKLGPAFGNTHNRGVRALFAGASGTGKTMAAKILAAELGMDLYRVDLAAVINKYIGETEKNLHQVLTQAESLDVILLLDEGDALLGGRTDVKSANDRYANMETNYLLQRLENYQGIVLVTSNLAENIDRAFQRRMDVVVPFSTPQAEQRMRIMELHLPLDHEVDYDFLKQVATNCALTGGQIRNTCIHASMLAMDEGAAVNRYHLEDALKSEFRKAGALSPLEDSNRNNLSRNEKIDSFISALENHY